MKTVYASVSSSSVVPLLLWNKVNLVGSTVLPFSKRRCENGKKQNNSHSFLNCRPTVEAMSGTLLLPTSPDAISDSTCATTGRRRRKESVLALLKITTALDVQLHFRDPAMKSGLFFSTEDVSPPLTSPALNGLDGGGEEASPNQAGRKSHISHLTPGVPRKLDSLRVLQEGAGCGCEVCRCIFLYCVPPPPHPAGILTGGESPSGQDVSQPHATLEGRTARTMP